MAAIEEPGGGDAEARAGERVARTDPVTAVFSRRVKPGREADFEDWAHGVIDAATRWPGRVEHLTEDADRELQETTGAVFPLVLLLRRWLQRGRAP